MCLADVQELLVRLVASGEDHFRRADAIFRQSESLSDAERMACPRSELDRRRRGPAAWTTARGTPDGGVHRCCHRAGAWSCSTVDERVSVAESVTNAVIHRWAISARAACVSSSRTPGSWTWVTGCGSPSPWTDNTWCSRPSRPTTTRARAHPPTGYPVADLPETAADLIRGHVAAQAAPTPI